jgi:hypothetical protein
LRRGESFSRRLKQPEIILTNLQLDIYNRFEAIMLHI